MSASGNQGIQSASAPAAADLSAKQYFGVDIDSSGNVAKATVLKGSGHGFDEAAEVGVGGSLGGEFGRQPGHLI